VRALARLGESSYPLSGRGRGAVCALARLGESSYPAGEGLCARLLDSESQAGLMKILENRETGIARN